MSEEKVILIRIRNAIYDLALPNHQKSIVIKDIDDGLFHLESLQSKAQQQAARIKELEEREQTLINHINSKKKTMPQFQNIEEIEKWLGTL